MNDPQVTALHYWVNHDDSVDYAGAEPLEYEDNLLHLILRDRELTIEPKNHYATEEEALDAVEGFLHHWEFEATLDSGSSRFSLTYAGADESRPKPRSTSTRHSAGKRHVPVETRNHERSGQSGKNKVPRYPIWNPTLRLDDAGVQEMLAKISTGTHQRRETLPGMAYFCYTALQKGATLASGHTRNKMHQVRDHYAIDLQVLRKISELSSIGGGTQARKAIGTTREFYGVSRNRNSYWPAPRPL